MSYCEHYNEDDQEHCSRPLPCPVHTEYNLKDRLDQLVKADQAYARYQNTDGAITLRCEPDAHPEDLLHMTDYLRQAQDYGDSAGGVPLENHEGLSIHVFKRIELPTFDWFALASSGFSSSFSTDHFRHRVTGEYGCSEDLDEVSEAFWAEREAWELAQED